jgi:hypothetical protein
MIWAVQPVRGAGRADALAGYRQALAPEARPGGRKVQTARPARRRAFPNSQAGPTSK